MKKSPYPQRKKALLWGSLALVCFLAVLSLTFLESAPCFTLEQAMGQAETQNAAQKTRLLDSQTLDNTTFYLTGNEDVLMVIPFYGNPLVRLKKLGNDISCFDRSPNSPAQAQQPSRLWGASMSLKDTAHDRVVACVLGTTQLPEAASVTVAAALASIDSTGEEAVPDPLWIGATQVMDGPDGYDYFWLWTVLPPADNAHYYIYSLTLFDQAGKPITTLDPEEFSWSIQGERSIS